MSDIDRGREALKYFHNKSATFPGYSESLDTLIDKVGGKQPTIFLDGLGFAVDSIGLSSGQVKEAMEKLASQGQGRIPAYNTAFFKALSDRATNLTTADWIGGLPEIAGDTAKDLASGAQAVGNAVIDLGKSLTTVGPLLALAAIIFIGFQRTRKLAG